MKKAGLLPREKTLYQKDSVDEFLIFALRKMSVH